MYQLLYIDLRTHEMLAAAQDFYANLGTMARDKRWILISESCYTARWDLNFSYYSVTVSVFTTKGTQSRLLELGRVADISGGQVYSSLLVARQKIMFLDVAPNIKPPT